MFPTTQPMDAADSRPIDAPPTALTSLSPSLLQDLQRFEVLTGPKRELLEVLAACVRHQGGHKALFAPDDYVTREEQALAVLRDKYGAA